MPPCATKTNKAGILIYGHGFFGNLDELRNGEYLRDLSQNGCLVIAGTVWVGFSSDDTSNAALALNDLNHGIAFGEHGWQGIVDFIAREQLLRGKLASDLLVDSGSAQIRDLDLIGSRSFGDEYSHAPTRTCPWTRSCAPPGAPARGRDQGERSRRHRPRSWSRSRPRGLPHALIAPRMHTHPRTARYRNGRAASALRSHSFGHGNA